MAGLYRMDAGGGWSAAVAAGAAVMAGSARWRRWRGGGGGLVIVPWWRYAPAIHYSNPKRTRATSRREIGGSAVKALLRVLPWTALFLGMLVMGGSAFAYEQPDLIVAAAQADSVQVPPPPPPQDQVTPAPATQTTPPPATQTAPPPAQATTPPPAKQQPTGPFGKGTRRATFTAGWGRSFGEDYLLLGLGVGYFIRNGVAFNIGLETWALNDPNVTKLTPELQIVVPRPRGPRPYLAGFWRHAWIEDAEDLSSIGGRVGIYNKVGARSAGGIGAVYEHYLDCNESIYSSCSQVYPEAVFGVSF
jgi:hypothetical protein